jgi:gluconolactonase
VHKIFRRGAALLRPSQARPKPRSTLPPSVQPKYFQRNPVNRLIMKIAGMLAGILLLCDPFSASSQNQRPPRVFDLEASSPEFWSLISKQAKLETVATGFGFTEGPVWDKSGFLYVSDEELNKIFRVYPDGHREELISLGDPDGNTYDRALRLIDCASVLRAIIRISPDGQYAVLADRYQGKKFNSPNDVVVGPDGAIYFADPTLDLPQGEKQEIPFQGVYRLDENGNVTLLTRELSQPNGLAFSPDGKHFYIDDSKQRNIRVYDFAANATLANGRIFAEEPGGKGDGVPDGMRVDREGNIYVTGPKGIWVWDPHGHHLGTIVIPEQPANLTWGDADYRTLYITATKSVYRIQMKARGFVPYLDSVR